MKRLFSPTTTEHRSASSETDVFKSRRGGGTAGQLVTNDTSNQLMAVWRCRNLIADMVGGTPVHEFTRDGADRTPVLDVSSFIADPSELVDAHDWRWALVHAAVSTGNGYAYGTEYDARGFVVRAETVPCEEVTVRQPSGFLSPPVYKIGRKEVDAKRMLHLRAFGPRAGSVMGLNPIAYAHQTIGLGLAVRDFGANWYASGGHPTTALIADGDLDDIDAMRAKESFRAATTDDHIVALGNGWKLESVQVNPDDALFLAATNASGVDICGYHGIPASMLGYAPPAGGTLTYQNGEQRMLDLLVMTLQWWFGRLERVITGQLRPERYVKCNMDALLRSDAMTRWKIHQIAVTIGARNIDEVRSFEETTPLPNGAGERYVWPPVGVAPDAGDGEQQQVAARSSSAPLEPAAPAAPAELRAEHHTHVHLFDPNGAEQRELVYPTPVVNVAAPVVNVAAPVVNVPPATVTVNVEPSPLAVNIEPAPAEVTVNVEPTPITVAAATVTVPTPTVTVLQSPSPASGGRRSVKFTRNNAGQITGAEVAD